MKMAGTTLALAALMVSFGVSPTESQAAPDRQHELTRLGYRVLVEPEIVEDSSGRLRTRRVTWKLRAIHTDSDGRLVHVRAVQSHHEDRLAVVADSQVDVRRPWQPEDHPRQSAIFRDFERALRRFNALRLSDDIRLLADHADRAMAPTDGPAARGTARPAPRRSGCRSELLAKGFHPSHLQRCEGAEERCAVALLRQGHHPSNLARCRGDLTPGCSLAVLRKGFHPAHLEHCVGVDGLCAATLLNQGHHPRYLNNCRR